MAMDNRYFSMGINTKDAIQKESQTDLVAMIGKIVVFMKDNLNKDIEMVEEC